MSPRRDGPAWRWSNIPIPQAHLVGLGTGILLQVVAPWSLPWPAWIGHGCGWPLILAGLCLGAWAARAAAGVDLERPDQLVDSGPLRLRQEPDVRRLDRGLRGAALVAGTAWPLLLLPAVLGVTQVVVLREERSLERRFGAAYRSYKHSVRRYL